MENIDYLYMKIKDLLDITKELNIAFEEYNKKFPLDGLLLGNIGEVAASFYYGLELYRNSNPVHDGFVGDKRVQIKITQCDKIDIKENPDYLIVLFLDKNTGRIKEVYNGVGERAWNLKKKKHKNGEYSISINKLKKINLEDKSDKIEMVNNIEIYV